MEGSALRPGWGVGRKGPQPCPQALRPHAMLHPTGLPPSCEAGAGACLEGWGLGLPERLWSPRPHSPGAVSELCLSGPCPALPCALRVRSLGPSGPA